MTFWENRQKEVWKEAAVLEGNVNAPASVPHQLLQPL